MEWVKYESEKDLKEGDTLFISHSEENGMVLHMGHKRTAISLIVDKESGDNIGLGFYPMLDGDRAVRNIGVTLIFDGPFSHDSIEYLIQRATILDQSLNLSTREDTNG